MKLLIITLIATLAISCGGGAESPTSATPTSGNLLGSLAPDSRVNDDADVPAEPVPAPPADPEPGADPAPPAPTPEPTPAPALSLAGTWTGTISIPGESRPVPIKSWTATQSGASVSGPVVVDAGDGNIQAALTGTVSGAQLTSATFSVASPQPGLTPGCSFSGIGTLEATPSSISGSLAMTFPAACVGPDNVSHTATATWTLSLTNGPVPTPTPSPDPTPSPSPAPSSTERDALVALYNSTGGANWTTQTNWNGAAGTQCTWYGIMCAGSGDNQHVIGVSLPRNNLAGAIPSLTGLTNLWFFQVNNNRLTGPIPPLSELTKLRDFNGAGNQLTGPVPSLAGLTDLTDFNVVGNQLTGTIPSPAGLTKMNDFSFSDNQLTGTIPSLAGLPLLKYFLAANNRLTGTIPSLTGLTSLAYFQVHNNQLTGTIPSLAGLTSLLNFNVQNNQLTGPAPDVPSPSALLPRSSNLCPNRLTPSVNAAWDLATGSTPWSQQCS